MTLTVPLSLIFAHWLGDWFLQNDWMALGKSKAMFPLVVHVGVVSVVLALWCWMCYSGSLLVFVGLNGLLHLLTDYVTSRINGKLYQAGHRHWFFVSIGFDQVLHYAAYAILL